MKKIKAKLFYPFLTKRLKAAHPAVTLQKYMYAAQQAVVDKKNHFLKISYRKLLKFTIFTTNAILKMEYLVKRAKKGAAFLGAHFLGKTKVLAVFWYNFRRYTIPNVVIIVLQFSLLGSVCGSFGFKSLHHANHILYINK